MTQDEKWMKKAWMQAKVAAKKGEVHLLYSETPCSLVPLSEFGKQEMA